MVLEVWAMFGAFLDTWPPLAQVADKGWVEVLPPNIMAVLSKDALRCLQHLPPHQLEALPPPPSLKALDNIPKELLLHPI